MSILNCIPAARPIRLAGRLVLCRERTIADIAYLESLALAARPPRLSADEPGIDPAERRRRLRTAFDEAEAGNDLPTWGSPEVTAIVLGTSVGRQEYLRRTLAEAGLSPEQLAELDAAMTETDWVRLLEATGPREALAKADRAILQDIGIAEFIAEARAACASEESFGLREAIAWVCKELGKSPAELASWTVSELAFVLSGGKLAKVSHDCPPSVDRETWRLRVMKPLFDWWHVDDAPPDTDPTPTATIEPEVNGAVESSNEPSSQNGPPHRPC